MLGPCNHVYLERGCTKLFPLFHNSGNAWQSFCLIFLICPLSPGTPEVSLTSFSFRIILQVFVQKYQWFLFKASFPCPATMFRPPSASIEFPETSLYHCDSLSDYFFHTHFIFSDGFSYLTSLLNESQMRIPRWCLLTIKKEFHPISGKGVS